MCFDPAPPATLDIKPIQEILRQGIASVPPGEYYVVAIPESQSRDWTQPARLNGIASLATHVTILEGEHRTVDLQTHDLRQ